MKSWKFYAKYAKKYRKKMWKQGNGKPIKKDKAFYQKYGFFKEDTWALSEEHACWLLPRIAYLRDVHHGFPTEFCTFLDGKDITDTEEMDAKWTNILNQIAKGLYLYLKKQEALDALTYKEQQKINEAFALLKRYHMYLSD